MAQKIQARLYESHVSILAAGIGSPDPNSKVLRMPGSLRMFRVNLESTSHSGAAGPRMLET